MQADRSGSPVGTSEERDLDYFERRAEEELALAQNAELVRVVKKSTAEEMLKLMESVVDHGTGYKERIPGYRVGGKTGTGQAASAKGYDGYTYSFAGVAPLEDPQFVVVATMYRPKGNWKDFSVADTFTDVMSHTLNTFNVPPSTTKSEAYDVFVGEDQKKSW